MNRSALPPCPKNHLVMAVLSTIFCCLPFGIVAIIKASQVNSFYMNGFYERAQISANDAQKWTIISVITGPAVVGLLVRVEFYKIIVERL